MKRSLRKARTLPSTAAATPSSLRCKAVVLVVLYTTGAILWGAYFSQTIYRVLFEPFTVNNDVAEILQSFLELPPAGNGIAIFYNIYTPNFNATQPKQRQRAIDQTAAVIGEQLDQITRSHAFQRSLTIHYTTIGLDPSFNNETTTTEPGQHYYYDHLFRSRNLTAHHLEHFEAGYEEVTLQYLWEYCREDNNHDATVIYMHSKGTYHDDTLNQNWRKHLLSAVTSDLCLEWRYNDDPQCNVCGLQFYPVWTHFFPGNFFAARCSYIRQLHPPNHFAARLLEISSVMRQQHYFRTTLYFSDGWTWGEGRYAAEFWVGSHPDLVPCDVAETAAVKDMMRASTAPLNFSYAVTPRFAVIEKRHMLRQGRLLALNATLRDREYYLLAGNLVKWQMLYGAVPEANSWVWDYYTDGKLWKELVMGNATASALQSARRDGHDEEWLRYLLSTKMLTAI